jgi:APA family basic amino acid/polyamine antiporter
VPLVPVVPLIGAALCIYLMAELPAKTWERFGIWMVIGLAIYLLYSRTHSALQRGEDPPEAGEDPSEART